MPHPPPAWEQVEAEGQSGDEPVVMEANVDIILRVLVDWHFVQGTPLSSPMRRISENRSPQASQVNSYIGIGDSQILRYF
jgi:hypothetical protein